MSVEEDVELRDLVTQTLNENGCLAKLKSELRASIFLAVNEDNNVSKKQPLLNSKIKSCLESNEGKAMFCLVREFLEFFNLYFTLSVYEPESYLGTAYTYEGAKKTAMDLGIEYSADSKVPLIMQLIKIVQNKNKLDINLNLNQQDNITFSETCSNIRTESESESNVSSNNSSSINSEKGEFANNLNATYDVSSPFATNLRHSERENKLNQNTNSVESQNNIEDNYSQSNGSNTTVSDTSVMNKDAATTNNKNDMLQPIVKENKSPEKLKLSPPISDKLKSKGSLNCLSDLPPIQVTKPRTNDILPSLYNKEFKERTNLALFDTDIEYEEDFLSTGDELSLTADYLKSGHTKSNSEDLSNSSNHKNTRKTTLAPDDLPHIKATKIN